MQYILYSGQSGNRIVLKSVKLAAFNRKRNKRRIFAAMLKEWKRSGQWAIRFTHTYYYTFNKYKWK